MAQQKFLSPLLIRIAALLLLVGSTLPPLIFYYSSRNFIAGNLEAEAEETARQITRIVTRNPEMWQFEQERIDAILDSRPDRNPLEIRRLFNADNEVVSESLRRIKTPLATSSHEIMDSGVEVGRLAISRSLRPVIYQALLIQGFFLSLGLIFFSLLRLIIDRSLGESERQLYLYQNKLRDHAEVIATTQESERRALATVLHDDVSQILSLCQGKLEALPGAGDRDCEVRDIAGARKLLSQAIVRTRNLMESLSSQMLEELGLPAAIDELCRTMEKEHGLHISLKEKGDFTGLPRRTRAIFFRAVRELLTNTVKHADARSVAVTLLEDDGLLRLTVTDDGRGMDIQKSRAPSGGGFGLFSIRESVQLLGGTVDIRSPGGGTRIVLEAPSGVDAA